MATVFDGRFANGIRFPANLGDAPNGYYGGASGPASGVQYVNDPIGVKGVVARMTCYAGSPLWANGWRTEASLIQVARGLFCYHESVLLADGWDGDWPFTIIYQQHGNDSTATYGRPPAMEISAVGPANRALVTVWSRTDPTASSTSTAAMTQRKLWVGYLDLTKWLDITVNVNWQYDNTGWLDLYFNGVRMAGFTGAGTCYQEPEGGPFVKFGTYVQSPHDTPTSRDVTTYHAGAIITSGAAALAEMAALTGYSYKQQVVASA